MNIGAPYYNLNCQNACDCGPVSIPIVGCCDSYGKFAGDMCNSGNCIRGGIGNCGPISNCSNGCLGNCGCNKKCAVVDGLDELNCGNRSPNRQLIRRITQSRTPGFYRRSRYIRPPCATITPVEEPLQIVSPRCCPRRQLRKAAGCAKRVRKSSLVGCPNASC